MQLIVNQEEKTLDIRNEIESAQAAVTVYSQLEVFNTLDTRIKENLNKLEKSITEIKQKKFLRDIQDYKSDTVYNWNRSSFGPRTPSSILKRNAKRKFNPSHVNFTSTEADSSHSPSEVSDVGNILPDNATTSTRGGHSSNRGKKRRAGKKHRHKPTAAIRSQEQEVGNIQVFNLSVHLQSENEISVLSRGLRFSPTYHFDLYRTILNV